VVHFLPRERLQKLLRANYANKREYDQNVGFSSFAFICVIRGQKSYGKEMTKNAAPLPELRYRLFRPTHL